MNGINSARELLFCSVKMKVVAVTSSCDVQGCQKLCMCKSCGFSLNALWNLEG